MSPTVRKGLEGVVDLVLHHLILYLAQRKPGSCTFAFNGEGQNTWALALQTPIGLVRMLKATNSKGQSSDWYGPGLTNLKLDAVS